VAATEARPRGARGAVTDDENELLEAMMRRLDAVEVRLMRRLNDVVSMLADLERRVTDGRPDLDDDGGDL
jgi:hypothetical protein